MGFIKSLVQTTKMGYEMQNNWDTGAQLQDASNSMAQMQQMMAQQTAGANLSLHGLDGTAVINAARQQGGMINMQPVVELDLTVLVPGRPPMPITVSQTIEVMYAAKAAAGNRVAVRVDPTNPQAIWINWAAPAPL